MLVWVIAGLNRIPRFDWEAFLRSDCNESLTRLPYPVTYKYKLVAVTVTVFITVAVLFVIIVRPKLWVIPLISCTEFLTEYNIG